MLRVRTQVCLSSYTLRFVKLYSTPCHMIQHMFYFCIGPDCRTVCLTTKCICRQSYMLKLFWGKNIVLVKTIALLYFYAIHFHDFIKFTKTKDLVKDINFKLFFFRMPNDTVLMEISWMHSLSLLSYFFFLYFFHMYVYSYYKSSKCDWNNKLGQTIECKYNEIMTKIAAKL